MCHFFPPSDETMIPRLAEDHAHARLLADALGACPGLRVLPAPTNIVVAEYRKALEERHRSAS